MALALLFAHAFLAATILPFPSEATLLALVKQAEHPLWLLWLVATAGNSLGSIPNWLIGLGAHKLSESKLAKHQANIQRAERGFNRFGKWTLLFAWVPIIGDAFTVLAGMAKIPLPLFLLLVTTGKAARYGFVIYLATAL